jgi:hypothetical protein
MLRYRLVATPQFCQWRDSREGWHLLTTVYWGRYYYPTGPPGSDIRLPPIPIIMSFDSHVVTPHYRPFDLNVAIQTTDDTRA